MTEKILQFLLPVFLSVFLTLNMALANEIVTENGVKNIQGEKVANESLSLEGVEVMYKDTIMLTFNTIIDGEKEMDFIVENIQNNTELFIDSISVDGQNVEIITEDLLEGETAYEIVVLSLVGSNGATITSGVDGAAEFTTPDLSQFTTKAERESEQAAILEEQESAMEQEAIAQAKAEQEAINQAKAEQEAINQAKAEQEAINQAKAEQEAIDQAKAEQEAIDQAKAEQEAIDQAKEEQKLQETALFPLEENIPELLSAGEGGVDENLAGQDIGSGAITDNTTVVAGESKNLPSTGPENTILLMVIALLFGGMLLMFRKKLV